MNPAARVQAAIEIVDAVIAATRDNGPPADAIVQAYFKTRRYAGSKDRRAVRDLVFRAIRRSAQAPDSGRAAMIGLAEEDQSVADGFDGSSYGPAVRSAGEAGASPGLLPDWIAAEVSLLAPRSEWPALFERAPVDLRVHSTRAAREEIATLFPGSTQTPLSPWGLRLPADSQVSDHPAYRDGLVEVQDEGSQLIALACAAEPGQTIVDLCAGAGGKALAIEATVHGAATVIACDTNRARLARLPQRAARAHANIDTRLLNPPREAEELADLDSIADVVLVDAPCSGSGTWRRSPEGRWRLTPERLDRLCAQQAHVLDLAAPLVRAGGALVYATCSILTREGCGQAAAFLSRHSGWQAEKLDGFGGREDGAGRLLTPGHDSTDGFFVARFVRS